MKKSFYYIITLFAVCLLWSCSTKKNTKATRFYHAFNSRYNIYFNGKTSFDEALMSMQNGYEESYTDMILMYPVSAQPKDKETSGGPFDLAIEKGNKAIKLHSIQTKPDKKPGWRNSPKQRIFQEQEEYNPFLKHCWLMIGQGQFYNADFLQAAATFSYIARHYVHDEEVAAEARIWQARSYAEMDWLYETEDILTKLNINGIPKKKLNDYAAVYADYLVKNKQYEQAIPYFKTAIKAEKNKRQRTRMKYLLGQIYTNEGQNALAYKSFGEVLKSNPPYELEFAARIRQTEVFSDGNYQKIVKMLQGMAKSDKNKDYLDQVYYALGNVYLSRGDTAQAIANYERGVEKATRAGMDKAILWVKLGDIYFKQRDYIKAQPCFSGAVGIIQKEYKDYARISKLSAVLDELVVHAEAVHLQDSLQTLARMPEEERFAVIDKIIEQVIKEEEEAQKDAEREAYLAEQEATGTGIDRPGMGINALTIPAAGGGAFYFYNAQTVSQGKTQFQRKWGRRTLEDDWRRRNKRLATFEEITDGNNPVQEGEPATAGGEALPTDSAVTELPEDLSDDPKTREYYLQQIPLTEDDVAASNVIITDGLYNMAMIYKDKLEDLPLAVNAFSELERRFPANEHSLESYYQIYLMALRTEDTALASQYKSKIIAEYPGSDYAIAIADPNYEYIIRTMDSAQDSIYQLTYAQYLDGDIQTVRTNYQLVNEKYPLGALLPKFMFLDALTYVQEGDAEGFKEALKALVERYPDADVTELAGEMLKGVLRGRQMVQGDIRGMIWNMRFGGEGELSAADSARTFSAEKNTPHSLILMYPTGTVNKNQLLFAVAAYNFSNFMVKTFDLTQEENGPLSMLTISGFINFDEIRRYYTMIYGKDGYASSLGGQVAVIPISDENYSILMRGKTLDEYIAFLEETFGQEAPELTGRLKARLTEETEKREQEEEKVPVIEPPVQETEAPPFIADTTVVEEPEIIISKVVEPENTEQKQESEPEQQPDPEELRKRQEAEEKALLKAKEEREKQLESERAEQQKQAVADRKARREAQEELRKQKEREYKARQKQLKKERKEKERAYKKQLQEREKARSRKR
ncbi:MAG: tetratricopeptide repeat protein [Tannerellaceae bacterium]|nr:tetratricopeptide repeat protein [Tannerellaceae bacterium]